jgi:pyrroloquinoline quinone (PQQ) biosynthesis protein C
MDSDYVCRLRTESNALVDTLDGHPIVGAVVRGDASRDDYVRFLWSTYHYVRWSGTLLAATAEGLSRRGTRGFLFDLLVAKTREEAPHDAWVLHDLRACGENVELMKASVPPTAVQAYVTWSQTMAEDGSPAFLGAAYTLEMISMRRAKTAAMNLRARGTIPRIEAALMFLDGHGDADADHIATLETTLARIEDADDRAAIERSATVMATLYPRFFRAGA